MGEIFFWLRDPPDPATIVTEDWIRFLDLMANATSLIVASMAIFVVFVVYRPASQHRRIHSQEDLFAPYNPMRSLWLSVVGAFIAGGMCAWRYKDYLGDDAAGLINVSIQMS